MAQKGERFIQEYIDALRERDSYKPQEGEPQTERREALLRVANFNLKIAYAKLTGAMLGEVRRRLDPLYQIQIACNRSEKGTL